MTEKGRVYYHLTFSPYKRIPALFDEIDVLFCHLVREIAQEKGFYVLEDGIVPDHAHVLIEKKPWDDLITIIQLIKGITARRIFQAMPELRFDMHTEHFWGEGYHYVRHTEQSLLRARAYIRDQKRKHGLID